MHHPGRLSSSSFIPSSFSFSSSTIFSPSSPSSPSCSSSSSYLSPQPTDSATNSGVWRVRGRVITIFTCECILWIRMISPRYIDMIRLLHWPRILAVLKPCTLCVDERVNDDVIYTLGKRLAEYSRLIGGIPTKRPAILLIARTWFSSWKFMWSYVPQSYLPPLHPSIVRFSLVTPPSFA